MSVASADAGKPFTPPEEPIAPSALLDRLMAPAGSSLVPPRLLLVLAHPDDEVLAVGARLERLTDAHLLTVTDGAPLDGRDAADHGFDSLENYRQARTRELRDALEGAGLPPAVWNWTPLLQWTPVADQTAARHLVKLTRFLMSAIRALGPEAVLTHPYEGGHPDHDACAFAVHTAVRLLGQNLAQQDLARQDPARQDTNARDRTLPSILEAAFYHRGPGGMQTGQFLPFGGTQPQWHSRLSPEEQERKRRRLACFRSQQETLQQFQTEYELYRPAPRYHFDQPPHTGPLLYEGFPWGFTGAHFRELAVAATAQLEHRSAPDLPCSEPA